MRSKKAIYNIIASLVLQFVMIIYSFVVPQIIIRMFGSDVNGLVNSITKFLGYIALFEAGFGGVVQYVLYEPIAKKDTKKVIDLMTSAQQFFKKVCVIFIIYVLLLCIIYPFIVSNDFDNIYVISLIVIIAASTFAEYYFGLVYKIYLLANQEKYIASIFQISTYIINIIIIVIISNFQMPIQVFEAIICGLFILRPIIQNIYVKRKYNIRLNGNKKYEIKQKWDALAQHIASVVHNSTDIVILTIFCEISEVSVYSVYYMVIYGVRSICSVIYDSINAAFGDLIARREGGKLRNKFEMSETLYFTIVGILFSCTLVLIVPFVNLYTRGITDANYDRPLFALLLTLSEFVWAIRLPFSSIALAAGRYRQTRRGAILECLINVGVSLALVSQYGIIGVAIGTLVAMTIRTIEFVIYTNRHVINKTTDMSAKKIILLLAQVFSIVMIFYFWKLPAVDNYLDWGLNAIIVMMVSFVVVGGSNFYFYRNDFRSFWSHIKMFIDRRKDAK